MAASDSNEEEVFVKVKRKDVPKGAQEFVLVPLADLKKIERNVSSTNDNVSKLRPRVTQLCAVGEDTQKGVSDLADKVETLKIAPTKAAKGRQTEDGGRKVERPTKAAAAVGGAPATTAKHTTAKVERNQEQKATEPPPKRLKVTSGSSSEEDSHDSADTGAAGGDRKTGKWNAAAKDDEADISSDDNSGSPNDVPDTNRDNDHNEVHIDHDAEQTKFKKDRITRPVVHDREGKVGVWVSWDISVNSNVKFDVAVETAGVDRQLRKLKMASMQKLWNTNPAAFAEFFEEVTNGVVTKILREVMGKETVIFLENAITVSMGTLSDDQYVHNLPQPLRTAIKYAMGTFFDVRPSDEERRSVLQRGVAFTKPYVDSIRHGYPELKWERMNDDDDH